MRVLHYVMLRNAIVIDIRNNGWSERALREKCIDLSEDSDIIFFFEHGQVLFLATTKDVLLRKIIFLSREFDCVLTYVSNAGKDRNESECRKRLPRALLGNRVDDSHFLSLSSHRRYKVFEYRNCCI